MHGTWADDLLETYSRIVRVKVGKMAADLLSANEHFEKRDMQIEMAAELFLPVAGSEYLLEALVYRDHLYAAERIMLARGMERFAVDAKIASWRERHKMTRSREANEVR